MSMKVKKTHVCVSCNPQGLSSTHASPSGLRLTPLLHPRAFPAAMPQWQEVPAPPRQRETRIRIRHANMPSYMDPRGCLLHYKAFSIHLRMIKLFLFLCTWKEEEKHQPQLSTCSELKSVSFWEELHTAMLLKVAAARPCSDARPHTDYSIIFNPLNPSSEHAKR